MRLITLMSLIVAASVSLNAQETITHVLNDEHVNTGNWISNTIRHDYGTTVNEGEIEEIQKVVNKAYVGGIHNGGPIEDIRNGFHESFIMFIHGNNGVSTTTISEWISSIENARERNPNREITESQAKFVGTYVDGYSASVSLELIRDGRTVFTDHLLLYKFDEGWKIVAKTFYRH
jgi:hypothetical protein